MSGLEEAVTLLQAAHRDLQALIGMLKRMVQDSVIRNFDVMVEAVKRLSMELRQEEDGLTITVSFR